MRAAIQRFFIVLVWNLFVTWAVNIIWNNVFALAIDGANPIDFFQAIGIVIFFEIARGRWDIKLVKSKDDN